MKVIVSNEMEQICPEFVGACLEADVVNSPYNEVLWSEIEQLGERFRRELTTESLKELTSISATRKVYRACGKDPSRYRPASEALIRRVLQGKELYQRDTLVDLINLAPSPTAIALVVSMRTNSWAIRSPWALDVRGNRMKASDVVTSTFTVCRCIVMLKVGWGHPRATMNEPR